MIQPHHTAMRAYSSGTLNPWCGFPDDFVPFIGRTNIVRTSTYPPTSSPAARGSHAARTALQQVGQSCRYFHSQQWLAQRCQLCSQIFPSSLYFLYHLYSHYSSSALMSSEIRGNLIYIYPLKSLPPIGVVGPDHVVGFAKTPL